jgi:Ni,Fe-hydrogenase I large subunit
MSNFSLSHMDAGSTSSGMDLLASYPYAPDYPVYTGPIVRTLSTKQDNLKAQHATNKALEEINRGREINPNENLNQTFAREKKVAENLVQWIKKEFPNSKEYQIKVRDYIRYYLWEKKEHWTEEPNTLRYYDCYGLRNDLSDIKI